MKTARNKLMKLVLVVAVVTQASPAVAYPPDNAAVLYYKAFTLYERPDDIGNALWDYWKGRIESNKKIEECIEKNRRIIDIVLDATRIDHCDWGLDYSQGAEVLLPPHNKARDIFALLAAEARTHADKGDYKKALGRCISTYRMARHLNERPIICYLVGTAINAATDQCVTQLLSEMPQDREILTWLRGELAGLDMQPFSVMPALTWKREAGIVSMSPERISDVVQSGLDDSPTKKKIFERISTADQQFFARNIAYWSDFMDRVKTAFGLPYSEAYATLKQLDKDASEDFEKNPDATLTMCLAPTFLRIYVLSVRLEAGSDALRTAVEVYLAKARTGQLPEALPDNLPAEPFSGKPFEYTRTADGFVLRCRGKDLDKDEAYEYEFKVKR